MTYIRLIVAALYSSTVSEPLKVIADWVRLLSEVHQERLEQLPLLKCSLEDIILIIINPFDMGLQ